jgi:hypothetical protein
MPVVTRECRAEVSWDLPTLASGITRLVDVTVAHCRVGDRADAALASSTRVTQLDATAWVPQHGPGRGAEHLARAALPVHRRYPVSCGDEAVGAVTARIQFGVPS